MARRVRELTAEERSAIARLARARTAPAREVERARIIRAAAAGLGLSAIARRLGLRPKTVRRWIDRFNAQGLAGLRDAPRSGRPPTYTPEQVGELVALALTDPRSLGLPFDCWTLDRLAAYVHEHRGIGMKRGRIDQVLLREGLPWGSTASTRCGRRAPRATPTRGSSEA
jgi:transposase